MLMHTSPLHSTRWLRGSAGSGILPARLPGILQSWTRLVIFAVLLLAAGTTSFGQTITEDFKGYADGSDGSPRWHPAKGFWQVLDGSYREQSGSGEDCATLLDRYFRGSLRCEITFELLSGDAGMGLVFSSSSLENIGYSQLVRFDGPATILTGYFENGEFTAEQSVQSPATVMPLQRHLLALAIDREHDRYSASLDGRPAVQDLPLMYPSGYLGLSNIGGAVRFLSVSITAEAAPISEADLSGIGKFTRAPDGTFLVPSRSDSLVLRVDPSGSVVARLGSPASRRGQLHAPSAIAMVDDSSFVVADKSTNQIHRISLRGRWLSASGGTGTDPGRFDDPAAIAVSPRHELFVVDRGNRRIQVLDRSGKFISQFGKDILSLPADIALDGDRVYVLNAGRSRIERYRWDGKLAHWEKSISYGGGEGRGLAVVRGRCYLAAVNKVAEYDTSGKFLREFLGRSADFIHPQSLVADPSAGTMYIADYFRGRIIGTPLSLADPQPQISDITEHSATVSWDSPVREAGRIVLTAGKDTIRTVNARTSGTHHTATLSSLTPNTSYRIQFTPHVRSIPAARSLSRWYPFTTSAGPRVKQFARIPMVAMIFTNVHDTAGNRTAPYPQPPLPDSEVSRIKAQLEDGVRFYWVHSGMRLFLDLHTLVITDSVGRNDLFGPESWYPPRDSMIAGTLAAHGMRPGDVTSILYLSCTQRYDTSLHHYVLAGKGGAFTNGVGTGKGYGISWWDVTRANHNAGNNWLMVHEFNHQLDDIFMVSGYPEYWFNHISPTIGTAGPFGEHFDANAYIIHMVPPQEWLDLRYTIRGIARDADEDGIPDNDPSLPLDEVRLGSDSTSRDSDHDGVPDFDELEFSNWITEGWGETAPESYSLPNLHSADADEDGIPDGKDSAPCSNARTVVAHVDPLHPVEPLPILALVHDGKINATVRAGWTEDSLLLEIETDRRVPLKIMLDGNGDGWFLGSDNLLFTIPVPEYGTPPRITTQLFNGTDPYRWPFMDDSLGRTIGYSFSSFNVPRTPYHIRLAVARSQRLALEWVKGNRVGLNVGFLCPFDADGSQRYVDMYEPNRLLGLTLQK